MARVFSVASEVEASPEAATDSVVDAPGRVLPPDTRNLPLPVLEVDGTAEDCVVSGVGVVGGGGGGVVVVENVEVGVNIKVVGGFVGM